MEKKIIKPFDDSVIENHAAKVGGKRNLRLLEIESDDEIFVYLVKKPNRSVMQAVTSYESKKDTDGMQKVMLGCVLEGDKEAFEHDASIYVKILAEIGKLIHSAKASLKNV